MPSPSGLCPTFLTSLRTAVGFRERWTMGCVRGRPQVAVEESRDGSDKVQLTVPPLQAELPRWSPDGKWIAFMGQDPGQPWKVRVVSAEGGPTGR